MATLATLRPWLAEARLIGGADAAKVAFSRVHSDTRTLRAGDLFVALKGERFDANDMLAQARACGAACAIAERGLAAAGVPGYEVTNSLQALSAIARGWRAQFDLPLIAVTGSNGKTTVTQMIAAMLRAACMATGDGPDAALATAGNFNNEIGLPLTLLRLTASHRLAVVELGMNHPGEIARLAAMAVPTVALVNNAQREHLEFMASVDAVARENGAVFDHLAPTGTAVFPAHDAFAPIWRERAAGRRCLTFGETRPAHAPADAPNAVLAVVPGAATEPDVVLLAADWHGDQWHLQVQTPAGTFTSTLALAGRHNVMNALAASACALAAGVTLKAIAEGLAGFAAVKGRSQARRLQCAGGHTLTLVDDSYNANPDSVRAAIDLLAALPPPRLLVLGDMGEVGADGARLHAEVGAYARERGIEVMLAHGALSEHSVRQFGSPHGRHFADLESLSAAVLAQLAESASVLIKGSRFMRMERVVQAIEASQAIAATGSQPVGEGATC
ncbi:MAG: UDP-N-acetylmuramoyl-tripeptide--D-alanyl-D-alanine ligase [Variovorax sp.]